MSDTKATTLVPTNPAPEIPKAYRFEGFRDKVYGKVDSKDALKVRQMILTNDEGKTFHVTVSDAQQPYLPKKLVEGDILMVQARQTIAGVTDHLSKDLKSLVFDKTSGVYPTAMVDDRATTSQIELFNLRYKSMLTAEASAKAQMLKAKQSAEVLKAKVDAVKSLSEEDRTYAEANAAVIGLLED